MISRYRIICSRHGNRISSTPDCPECEGRPEMVTVTAEPSHCEVHNLWVNSRGECAECKQKGAPKMFDPDTHEASKGKVKVAQFPYCENPAYAICAEEKAKARRSPTANPKDLIGAKKLSLTKLPFVGILQGNAAMAEGEVKYGPFNWREYPVQATIYIDAALRHLALWLEREEKAPDSGVSHLGHVIAGLSILLDAQATGNLIDDRPKGGSYLAPLLAELNEHVRLRGVK